MANPEHRAIIQDSVAAWNTWRKAHPQAIPDLIGVNLSGRNLSYADLRGAVLLEANLHGADLRWANLSGAYLHESDLVDVDVGEADLRWANLHGANLRTADFSESDLRDADLSESKLHRANFQNTDLHGTNLAVADLSEADLRKANLHGANLSGTKLEDAFINNTIFADLDLGNVKGLDKLNHSGPSTVGIDTIYRSNGNIPETFLRGCGVPEQFITYARSLVGKAIEFYSCFISYSSKDQAVAERLHADLRAKDLRVWFAPEDLKIGDRFQERIEESIRLYDKIMIVLSEASVQSPWVEREVNAACERERRDKSTVLFPIRIDDAVMNAPQPWAADIRRTRYIGDFTKWKNHDSYQKAFERLLRDLRATEHRADAAR